MSKKKSKKKRAAHKKQQKQQAQQQATPVETKPNESAEEDFVESVVDAETETPDTLVADITEESEEPVPHHPITQSKIALALLILIGVLLLVIGYFVMSYNSTNQQEQLKSQDALLQVKPSDENSLQPTAGAENTNPQPTNDPGQTSTSAQDLQPQSSPTQQELKQLDQ